MGRSSLTERTSNLQHCLCQISWICFADVESTDCAQLGDVWTVEGKAAVTVQDGEHFSPLLAENLPLLPAHSQLSDPSAPCLVLHFPNSVLAAATKPWTVQGTSGLGEAAVVGKRVRSWTAMWANIRNGRLGKS